jgi:ribosomal-protein-alanine N-acetyltransferase
MIAIETNRLLIRDHLEEDLLSMHALYSSPDEMRFLPGIKTNDIRDTEKILRDSMDAASAAVRSKYFFAITDKSTGEYIGEIGYMIEQFSAMGHRADLGYFINKKCWNKGFVSEAGKAVVADAFAHRDIRKMTTGCLKDNIASEKVMIKLGFIKEAEFKEHVFLEGVWKDRVQYRLLKDDFLGRNCES